MKVLRPDTCDPIGDYDDLYDKCGYETERCGYETERCGHANLSDISSQLLGKSRHVFKRIDRGVQLA